MNKGTDMALRVASLDYLGVVAARLRKDYVTSHKKLASIDLMISEIKAAESKDNDDKIKKVFIFLILLDETHLTTPHNPNYRNSKFFGIAKR